MNQVKGVLVLAAALTLGWAAQAQAATEHAGGFTFVTKSKDVGAGESAGAVAKCPKGTFALAGGVRTDSGFDEALAFDFPIGKGNDEELGAAWVGVAFNSSDSPIKLIGEAVCSKSKPKYRFDEFRVEANDQRNVLPECKGKERAFDFAMGGGFAPLNSGFPTVSGWAAFVDNSSDEDVLITTIITCLKMKFKTESSVEMVPGGAHATNSARCPSSAVAVSGGQSNGGGLAQINQITASTVNQNEFETGIDNLAGGEISVNTIAICVNKR